MLTALTQPSPEALREAIRETRHIMNGREGKFVSDQSRSSELKVGRQHHAITVNHSSGLVCTLSAERTRADQ
jgi:hypothetical protein